MLYTEEPLYLMDTSLALRSLQDHGNTILPLKEDNLSITVKSLVQGCAQIGGTQRVL